MTKKGEIVKERESYRRGNQDTSVWPQLWDLAETYAYSARRLYDHAKGKSPRILGIAFVDGNFVLQGDPRNFIGPLSDEYCDYLMPKWAGAFSVQLATSSPISSAIWQRRGDGALRATISGAWVQMVFQ